MRYPRPGPGDLVFACQACGTGFLVPSASLAGDDGDAALGALFLAGLLGDKAALPEYASRSAALEAAAAQEARRVTQCPNCRSGSARRVVTPAEREAAARAAAARSAAERARLERLRVKRAARAEARARRRRQIRNALRYGPIVLSAVLLFIGANLPWLRFHNASPPPYFHPFGAQGQTPEHVFASVMSLIYGGFALRALSHLRKGRRPSTLIATSIAAAAGLAAIVSLLADDHVRSDQIQWAAQSMNYTIKVNGGLYRPISISSVEFDHPGQPLVLVGSVIAAATELARFRAKTHGHAEPILGPFDPGASSSIERGS